MGGGRVVRFRPAWQTVSGKPDESIQSRLEGVFRSALTVISATPAQHFFLQGDPPSGVHVVRRGTVILYSITEAGQRHIQQVARTGDCFAVDLSHPHRLSGQALTDVETWHVPRREASQAIETDAGARELVFDLMDQQLAAAHFRSELLNSRSAKQKCAAFLLSIEEGLQPGWAPGADSWIDEILTEAHATNIAAEMGTAWGEVSPEALLALNPEVLLIREA